MLSELLGSLESLIGHCSGCNHTAGYVPAKAKEVTGNLPLNFAVCRPQYLTRRPVYFFGATRPVASGEGGDLLLPSGKVPGEERAVKRITLNRMVVERLEWWAVSWSTPGSLASYQSQFTPGPSRSLGFPVVGWPRCLLSAGSRRVTDRQRNPRFHPDRRLQCVVMEAEYPTAALK